MSSIEASEVGSQESIAAQILSVRRRLQHRMVSWGGLVYYVFICQLSITTRATPLFKRAFATSEAQASGKAQKVRLLTIWFGESRF